MRAKDLIESIKTPFLLILYGIGVIALQPLLIKALGVKPGWGGLYWNAIGALLITLIDSGLFYLWYKIIQALRAHELRKAQRYSGSSRSDRPS